jgi:hypothetical protein
MWRTLRSNPFTWQGDYLSQIMKIIYGIDSHGAHWHWNCGWRLLENSSVLLTHQQFKSIKIVAWSEIVKPLPPKSDRSYFHKSRPYSTWRRADEKLYEHLLYGEVQILLTDGVHAIVRGTSPNDIRVEVHLSNLYEIKVRSSGFASVRGHKKEPKFGDLTPYIKQARAQCKSLGYPKPTDSQLRLVAEMIKESLNNLFK